jgi:branched-subunit amino acid ABC-type transport system permease component
LLIDGALAGAVYELITFAFVLVYKASRMINFATAEWVMWGVPLAGAGVHVRALTGPPLLPLPPAAAGGSKA